jgi:hypothetical protein
LRDTIIVTVRIGDDIRGDVIDTEIIVLTETTETSGIFRNASAACLKPVSFIE